MKTKNQEIVSVFKAILSNIAENLSITMNKVLLFELGADRLKVIVGDK